MTDKEAEADAVAILIWLAILVWIVIMLSVLL